MYFNLELIKHDLCVLVIHVFSGLFILMTYCSYIYFFAVFYFYGFLMESNAIASYSGGTNLYLHIRIVQMSVCVTYLNVLAIYVSDQRIMYRSFMHRIIKWSLIL